MSVIDVFTRPVDGYTRKIDVIDAAKDQAVKLLMVGTNLPEAECREYVERRAKEDIKDPVTRALVRGENGDRYKQVTTYGSYIKTIEKENLTFVPTLTAYLPPEVKRGSAADFIDAGITQRAVHKGLMRQALSDKNTELATIEDLNQSSCKLDNNSYSGAMAIANCILYLASGHPALTSTCRTTTSYANSNNEKLLGGNRHYWSYDITVANLMYIITETNMDDLKRVIDAYDMHWPTAEETFKVVEFSTKHYWSNQEHITKLKDLINNCSDLERAAICYMNDLYHIRIFNDGLVRGIFDKLIQRDEAAISAKINEIADDAEGLFRSVDEDLAVMAATIAKPDFGEARSIKGLLDTDKDRFTDTIARALLAEETFKDYDDFWKVFVANDIMPHTVSNVKYIYRKVVVGGDTDSTIFTSQNWTEWYSGKLEHNDEGTAVTGVTTFLASKTIAHILFSMSKNMGVSDTRLDQLGLKNEFLFPIFMMTGKAKHYATYQEMKEGVFFDELVPEIKGVGLRGSNVPPIIFKSRRKLFTTVMDQVMANGKVDWQWLVGMQSALEHEIDRSILAGEKTYLARLKIKEKDQYKTPMSSAYAHYDLYMKVFADKYGDPGPLPWSGVKIPLTLDTKTALKNWIASIKDPVIARRLDEWFKANAKSKYTTMGLPTSMIDAKGIPEEIVNVINSGKIQEEVSSAFYITLEACGLYFLSGNDKYRTLISDQVEPNRPALLEFLQEFLEEDGKDDHLYEDESDDSEDEEA